MSEAEETNISLEKVQSLVTKRLTMETEALKELHEGLLALRGKDADPDVFRGIKEYVDHINVLIGVISALTWVLDCSVGNSPEKSTG